MPTVYQGVYNYLDRTAEPEFAFCAPFKCILQMKLIWSFRLFPCLRKYGISFAAYSPLASVDLCYLRSMNFTINEQWWFPHWHPSRRGWNQGWEPLGYEDWRYQPLLLLSLWARDTRIARDQGFGGTCNAIICCLIFG